MSLTVYVESHEQGFPFILPVIRSKKQSEVLRSKSVFVPRVHFPDILGKKSGKGKKKGKRAGKKSRRGLSPVAERNLRRISISPISVSIIP
ncbi:unnamed protein product [Blepharisma stoltei]|uniref:Uncharacterized protein n=1 Tax=Blepharisma stoltei TaxID=1481888 RepID=A0AAU9K706_9CILI|nr:unnamed protein product [Blepharisma stoltei]